MRPAASAGCRLLATLLLAAAFGVSADHHAEVSAQRQQEIVAACTRTNQDYQFHRDRGNAEAYGALFTEDAEFLLQEPLRGREAIIAAMEARFADRATRHFINLVQLDVTGPDAAEGLVYLMVTGGKKAPEGPAPRGAIDLVAEYSDRYVMRGDRCLIQRRAVDIIFWMGPTN